MKLLRDMTVADSTEPGIGQYVANCERGGTIKMIRNLADQMEAHEDLRR